MRGELPLPVLPRAYGYLNTADLEIFLPSITAYDDLVATSRIVVSIGHPSQKHRFRACRL